MLQKQQTLQEASYIVPVDVSQIQESSPSISILWYYGTFIPVFLLMVAYCSLQLSLYDVEHSASSNKHKKHFSKSLTFCKRSTWAVQS